MTTKPLFTEGSKYTLLVPPNIQVMLTGVQTVCIAHPRYRLNYSDGSIEEAKLSIPAGADFFAIVSAVQAKRK